MLYELEWKMESLEWMKITTRDKEKLELAYIVENALVYWLPEIKHPTNILNWVRTNVKMTLKQIGLELWINNLESKYKSMTSWEVVSLWREAMRKMIRDKMQEKAEEYLWDVFDWKHDIKPSEKARLALDILKATDKEYNKWAASQIVVNLWELPLWENLLEAQKTLITEMWIDENTLLMLKDEQ